MNYKEILQLLGAGYSKDEIDAMTLPVQQPAQQPAPQPAQQIDYTALATAIVAAQQAANRAMNFGGQPQNDDLGKYF